MLISVRREPVPEERRVAVTPAAVSALHDMGHQVTIEPRAGAAAGFPDDLYLQAGADVETDVASADIVALVGPPTPVDIHAMAEQSAVIGLLAPFTDRYLLKALVDRRMTGLAFEAMPRTTLSQSMDALSSQSTAAGYAAVLAAASASPRFFPMLTTAAGTVRPSRVLVLGAGVAGLQVVATARRLGALVSAYDIRPEAREQVESLGARFVEAPTERADESGYAPQVDADTQRRQLNALTGAVAEAQVVITTALIPGRPAPLLITGEMVESMPPGGVVVDAAAPAGGNCELTKPGKTVVYEGVTILGPIDLPSRVAGDASEMYARNVVATLAHLTKEGRLRLDFEDEITDAICVTYEGGVRHPLARHAAGLEGKS